MSVFYCRRLFLFSKDVHEVPHNTYRREKRGQSLGFKGEILIDTKGV